MTVIALGALAWAEDGPASLVGGPRCDFGPEHVLATTQAPRGPFSVLASTGDGGAGLAVWQLDEAKGFEAQAFGPDLEPRGEAVHVAVSASHMSALRPIEGGQLFVAWGFSDHCAGPSECVVAARIDPTGALVGPPVAWPPDGHAAGISPGVGDASTGRVLRVVEEGTWDARRFSVLEVAVGADGPTFRSWPLAGPIVRPSDAFRMELRATPTGWVAAVQDHDRVSLHRDGALVASFTDADPLWGLDRRGVPRFLGGEALHARDPDGAGGAGPARRLSGVEAGEHVEVRLDVGGGYDRADRRISGLLLHVGDLAPVWVADYAQARVARAVAVEERRMLLAYVLADAAGVWRTVVREARCPR